MSTVGWADREIAQHLSRNPWCATRCGAGPFRLRDRARSDAAPDDQFFATGFANGDSSDCAPENLQILCVGCYKAKKAREQAVHDNLVAILTATVFAAQSLPVSTISGEFRAVPAEKFKETFAGVHRTAYLLSSLNE